MDCATVRADSTILIYNYITQRDGSSIKLSRINVKLYLIIDVANVYILICLEIVRRPRRDKPKKKILFP